MRSLHVLAAFLLLITTGFILLSQQKATDIKIVSNVVKPRELDATEERMRQLKLPTGFRIAKFAENLGKPRILAVAPDGTVYVTRREPGDCLMLRDTTGDGRVDQQQVVAKQPDLHGIALHGERAYFAAVREAFTSERRSDGTLGPLRKIVDDLGDGGQHPNRTLAIGPDGLLYISVGSTCNACQETNEKHATIVRAQPDGKNLAVFASGLRNTIGFGWHPQTGQMWGMDHNIDWMGDELHEEELNLLEEGKRYGWPYVYGRSQFVPWREPPGDITREQWAKMSTESVLGYTAHAAPMQMVFYTGSQFPAEYRNDAFVAMRGSWNRRPPAGYEIVRIRFRDGKPHAIEPFATGFLIRQGSDWGHIGRLTGLAQTPDGALLVSDDTNGVIFRIWYEKS